MVQGWRGSSRVPDYSAYRSLSAQFRHVGKAALEGSNPSHPRYGYHLSKREVEDLVASHPSSLSVVNSWLASHGIMDSDVARSPASDWTILRAPEQMVKIMLNTVSTASCSFYLLCNTPTFH